MLAVRELGFKSEFTVEEAKTHCRVLNKTRGLDRDSVRKAAKHLKTIITLDGTLFPQSEIDAFLNKLKEENQGSENHLQKLGSHFKYIQRMCRTLQILPPDYSENSNRIYSYFAKTRISPNYARRIVSLLNRWGKFSSKRLGMYWDPVNVPKGNALSNIADEQQKKVGKETELGVRTESLPLSPILLEQAKHNLKLEQYNWLKLTIWLGLRPEEVDQLKRSNTFKIENSIDHGIQVLSIYQSKLRSIAKEKRWKHIPIFLSEQMECLEIIKSKDFRRPLHKTIRKYVKKGVTLYGGRKGFVDLMMAKNQKLEDISMWLGHTDISTTWKHYKNKLNVRFTTLNSQKGA